MAFCVIVYIIVTIGLVDILLECIVCFVHLCIFSVIFLSTTILHILCLFNLLLWAASTDGRLPPLAARHCSHYCAVVLIYLLG